MDIRNIKTFVRVAELKSFTKAAEEMNYVQSTVTMQIQQLERELGYPVFDRIGKKVSLTAPGTEFLKYAYQILHVIDEAEALGKEAAELRGVLRIGVSETLMFGVLLVLLPTLKQSYKNLDIRIKTGHTPELIEELKHNRLDLVYLSTHPNTDPDLCCHYIKQEPLVFLCGNGHPLAQKTNIPFEDVMNCEVLLTEREGFCHKRLRELAAKHHVNLHSSMELDSVYVITKLVEQNMGLAFLPEFAVTQQLADGRLCKLDVKGEFPTYYSQILCHKDRWLSPFIRGTIDAIQAFRPGNN